MVSVGVLAGGVLLGASSFPCSMGEIPFWQTLEADLGGQALEFGAEKCGRAGI